MKMCLVFFSLLFFLSTSLFANSEESQEGQFEKKAECTLAVSDSSSLKRVVSIKYDIPEKACVVEYVKETELPGETKTLWFANNDKEYCLPKAKKFVTKLENLGWECKKS